MRFFVFSLFSFLLVHEILESGNLAPGRCEGNPEKVGGAIPVNWCDFPSPPPSQGVNSRQQLSLLPPTQASLHASHDLPFFFFSPFSLFEDVPDLLPCLAFAPALGGQQNAPPPNLPLWQKDDFEPKAIEKKQIQEQLCPPQSPTSRR